MRIFLFLLASALLWAQAAPSTDPVVMTIGTEKITKSQFESILASLPEQQQAAAKTPEGKWRFAQQLSELKLLSQDAKAKKLDQNPDVKMRLALQADQVLATAAYQKLGDGTIDDATLKAYYDEHKNQWEQVKARHILLRFQGSRVPLRLGQKDLTEEESLAKAKDLIAKIAAGAKFEEIAKAESDDTGSGAEGGELGFFSKGQMVPEFETAAFAQPVGKVGEPVKSAFGYHVILVEEHNTKSLADAKQDIENELKPEIAKKALETLKTKGGVSFNDEYFTKQ